MSAKKFYQVKTTPSYNSEWVSSKEVAKYVRQVLKNEFPKAKFSVRKSSGTGSINVSWAAGTLVKKETPTSHHSEIRNTERQLVEKVVKHLHGEGFDGMIDMRYSIDHYLLPSGEIVYAGTEGTSGSGGVYQEAKIEMPKGAKRVTLSNSFIFCQADY